MISAVHQNGGITGAATLLEQLPPGQLPLRLVLQYLSPKDVVAFQSTCRLLYHAIGLTPLDPPCRCFRLESHPLGFKTKSKQYFRVCPFFTSSPANLRRVHSCQVSVAYVASGVSRFYVVAWRVPSNAGNDAPFWNPITMVESDHTLPTCSSQTTLTFVPFGDGVAPGGSSNIKYYLVACGLSHSVQKVSVRTYLFDNSACAVFNRSSRGGEALTSELRQQYQTLLSRPIGYALPVSLPPCLAASEPHSSFASEYGNCTHYMKLFLDLRQHGNGLSLGGPKYDECTYTHTLSFTELRSLLRGCRLLRAPRLPCEACAVDTWFPVFFRSLSELVGLSVWMSYAGDAIYFFSSSWLDRPAHISRYDLLAMETILVAAIDEQHDVREENDSLRGELHQLHEEAHRSLDVDQRVSNWCHFQMAAYGVRVYLIASGAGVLLGTSVVLIRAVMAQRRR
jgi:F-box domain